MEDQNLSNHSFHKITSSDFTTLQTRILGARLKSLTVYYKLYYSVGIYWGYKL